MTVEQVRDIIDDCYCRILNGDDERTLLYDETEANIPREIDADWMKLYDKEVEFITAIQDRDYIVIEIYLLEEEENNVHSMA